MISRWIEDPAVLAVILRDRDRDDWPCPCGQCRPASWRARFRAWLRRRPR